MSWLFIERAVRQTRFRQTRFHLESLQASYRILPNWNISVAVSWDPVNTSLSSGNESLSIIITYKEGQCSFFDTHANFVEVDIGGTSVVIDNFLPDTLYSFCAVVAVDGVKGELSQTFIVTPETGLYMCISSQ